MRHYLFLGIAILLTSCSSTKITSNKDADYTGKINDVLVLFKSATEYKEFTMSCIDSLEMWFSGHNITTHVETRFSTEEEEDKLFIQDKIRSIKPNIVLVVNTVGIREIWQAFFIFPVKTGTYIEYNISALDMSTAKRFWRCDLQVNRSDYGQIGKKEAGQFARALVQQLEKDKLW